MIELTNGVFLFLGDSLGYGANCNSYLIRSRDEVLLIDSGFGKYNENRNVISSSNLKNPLEVLNNLINSNLNSIKMVAITHAHLDHIGGISSINNETRKQLTIASHKYERPYLESGDLSYIDPMTRIDGPKINIDKSLSNGDKIQIGDLNLEVIHTAGHTEGSLCLFEEDKKWLFSGDTVFPLGSFGRVDFPGSNPEDMIVSLDTIRSLEVGALFAGHMEPILGPSVKNNLEFSYKNAKAML